LGSERRADAFVETATEYRSGNLKAAQKLLGDASIQTTGDIYADWDIDQLAVAMAQVLADDPDEDAGESFQSSP
jgi:integrase